MTREVKEKIQEFKKQQIYALLSLPPGEERLDKLVKIIGKTDEELLEEMKDPKKFREDIKETFKCLFQKEGDINEDQKSK